MGTGGVWWCEGLLSPVINVLSGWLRCDVIALAAVIRLQYICVINNSTRECSSPLGCLRGQPTPKLYDRVVEVPRAPHYSRRTEEAYPHWIRRFILFHAGAHPREPGEGYVNTFLSHLAVKGNVAAFTEN